MTRFSVVIDESDGATDLTAFVTNLSFRSIDPGGFGSVTFDLSREIDAREFEDQADILVYNGETGEQVGGGRLKNPGRGVQRSGEVWQMEALGEGPAHAGEYKTPYIIADRRYTPWYQGYSDLAEMAWTQGGAPDDNSPAGISGANGLVFKIEDEAAVAIGDQARMFYYDLSEFPDARIGGYTYRHAAGRASANYRIQASSDLFATIDEDDAWALGATFVGEDVATSGTARTKLEIRYIQNTATLTANEKQWLFVWNFQVLAMRKDRDGNWVDSGTTYLRHDGVPDADPRTEEIVIDCLVRFCPRFDIANARIDVSSALEGTHWDSVWPDGITPADVMAEMKQRDPGFTWAVWERQSNGKWRVEWRAYDTDVRYELFAEDGYSETSSSTKYTKIIGAVSAGDSTTGHYNVFDYEDPDAALAARGIFPTTTVTGQVRDSELIGMLNETELEASAAQITVARKVYDHYGGRWVEPYSILPGYLCRVSGVPPRDDALNVGQVDGAAVYRVVSNEYSTSSATSRLELNAYTLTERRAIANLLAAQR